MTDYWAELFSEIIVIDPRSYLREESPAGAGGGV